MAWSSPAVIGFLFAGIRLRLAGNYLGLELVSEWNLKKLRASRNRPLLDLARRAGPPHSVLPKRLRDGVDLPLRIQRHPADILLADAGYYDRFGIACNAHDIDAAAHDLASDDLLYVESVLAAGGQR